MTNEELELVRESERTKSARANRSLAHLRCVIADLADELGLAEEDTSGIVRAVKARAVRITDEIDKLFDIVGNVGRMVKAARGESVESAVDRVVRDNAMMAATLRAVDVIAGSEESDAAKLDQIRALTGKPRQ